MELPFVLTRMLEAPVDDVWAVLTDTAQMKQWYFPALLEFQPVVGFVFRFMDDGSEYHKEWIVTQLVPGRRLAHSWAYVGYPGMSEVIFDLAPAGNYTDLRITHTGLGSFPDDPHFARSRFENGWARIIDVALKGMAEHSR